MPVGVSAYVALANVTLGSAATSVTFSSISQSYRDLVLVMNVGNNATTGFVGIFNSDTGANYSAVYASGNGSNVGSTAYSSQTSAFFGANVWSLNVLQQVYVINLMDYSATDKHKTFLSRADSTYSDSNTSMNAGRWASTSAITSIQIKGNGSSSFIAGSTLALYGIAS